MSDGTPARGYRWEDAKPGNTLALKHGAHSPRVYEPIACELVAAIEQERPDLAPFRHAVESWADAEARAALLREHLDEVSMFDAEGEPRRGLLEWLDRFEKRADAMRRRLGLDPLAAADLARQRVEAQRSGLDLDALRARGAEIVSARAEEVSDDE